MVQALDWLTDKKPLAITLHPHRLPVDCGSRAELASRESGRGTSGTLKCGLTSCFHGPVKAVGLKALEDLVAHVAQNVQERQLLERQATVLVAVSGGVDSMVLLHVLVRLAGALRFKLAAAHFNHQLRGRASDADEALVRARCDELGLACFVGRAAVRRMQLKSRASIEMVARDVRHQFLAKTACANGFRSIATAHHADDQVELFFLRLLRGAGSAGLSGMTWRGSSPADPRVMIIRPLLDVPKADLLRFAQTHLIPFREDASNQSDDFVRNRVRRRLLPMLRREFQPALTNTTARLVELLRAESDCLRDLASAWLSSKRRRRFVALPIALQRWILHAQLLEHGFEPAWDLIEHLRTQPANPTTMAPGLAIWREPGGMIRRHSTVQIEPPNPEAQWPLSDRQGTINCPGIRLRWRCQRQPPGGRLPERALGVELFDADRVGSPIVIRHWRPGDRFQPIGCGSPRKLQDIFVNQKIPRSERHWRYLAQAGNGEIFWVEGLRISEQFKVRPDTVRRLRWEWRRGE
jgi:tRNA(Ile)-lysidine synthase